MAHTLPDRVRYCVRNHICLRHDYVECSLKEAFEAERLGGKDTSHRPDEEESLERGSQERTRRTVSGRTRNKCKTPVGSSQELRQGPSRAGQRADIRNRRPNRNDRTLVRKNHYYLQGPDYKSVPQDQHGWSLGH